MNISYFRKNKNLISCNVNIIVNMEQNTDILQYDTQNIISHKYRSLHLPTNCIVSVKFQHIQNTFIHYYVRCNVSVIDISTYQFWYMPNVTWYFCDSISMAHVLKNNTCTFNNFFTSFYRLIKSLISTPFITPSYIFPINAFIFQLYMQ